MLSAPHVLTVLQCEDYARDGYVILRSFFSGEEIGLLRDTARRDRALDDHAILRADGEGGKSRLALWNHPGDGIYGMFARCDSMVGLAQQLLGEEPYHYHSKMIMKQPRGGGAWAWHQDYGYWYQNGVLRPDLCSVMIAVDPATRENGCLQVLRESHRMGRIDHRQSGDQAGADYERVQAALDRLTLDYCELDPGDLLAFHSNTLHRSDANHSDNPRWCMICCYNARSNNPYKPSHHPQYTPIDVVPRSRITEVGQRGLNEDDIQPTAWLNPKTDRSASSLSEVT
jgi:ectoine hydroxylase